MIKVNFTQRLDVDKLPYENYYYKNCLYGMLYIKGVLTLSVWGGKF